VTGDHEVTVVLGLDVDGAMEIELLHHLGPLIGVQTERRAGVCLGVLELKPGPQLGRSVGGVVVDASVLVRRRR
jgi:hypothetical protein